MEESLDISPVTQAGDGELAGWSQVVDLTDLVSAATADERLRCPGRPPQLTVHAPERASVRGDARHIRRALDQYLRNALKFSPADAPVGATLQAGDKLARVLVRDRGIGIPQDAHAHIWDRYTQVAGVTHVTGSSVGFGLGLYVCRAIVERHGGQVGMCSAPGAGSIFWFTLPLIDSGDTRRER